GCLLRHRRDPFLFVHWLVADQLAVRGKHAEPVDGESLAARVVVEGLFAELLRRLAREDLHHLPVRPGSRAVLVVRNHAVVQEQDVVLSLVVHRIDGQPVDRVILDGRIAGGGDVRGLSRQGGGGQNSQGQQGGSTNHETTPKGMV